MNVLISQPVFEPAGAWALGNTLLTCFSLPRQTGKWKTTILPEGSSCSNGPVMRHPNKSRSLSYGHPNKSTSLSYGGPNNRGSLSDEHPNKRGSVTAFCYPAGLSSSRRRGSSFSVSQPDRRRQSSTCTTSKWQIAEVSFRKYSCAECLMLHSTGDCGARAPPHTARLCADCFHGFWWRGDISVKGLEKLCRKGNTQCIQLLN